MPVFVEITAPIVADFRLTGNLEKTVSNILVRLESSPDGVVGKISLVKETTFDQVPAFTVRGTQGHIVEPRSDDVNYLEDRLAAVEGLLSAIGLDHIDFSRVGRRWFEAPNEWSTRRQLFGYTTDHEQRATKSEVLSPEFLEPLLQVAMNGEADNECLAQRFFWLGWKHFCNYRYIDSIQQLCFFFELSFADGKFKLGEQTSAAVRSTLFQTALTSAKREILEEVNRGDISVADAERLLINVEPVQFAKWVFSIRGNFLHQSSRRGKTWHPSNAIEHKLTATILASFCAAASHEMIDRIPF